MEMLTTELGDEMRAFVDKTCAKIDTKELVREFQARKRRTGAKEKKTSKSTGTRARKRQKTSESTSRDLNDGNHPNTDGDGRKSKTLNLNTYKFHALADVVPAIRLFGTTDSYSTQIPELLHRHSKRHYKRTSKRNVSRQLSRIQMRQARIRKLRKQLSPIPQEGYHPDEAQEPPYFIGKSENQPLSLPAFLQTRADDPAMKAFIPKLKHHLLPRIWRQLLEEEEHSKDADPARLHLLRCLIDGSEVQGCPAEPATADQTTLSGERQSVDVPDVDRIYFHSDRIYWHNILHINYTSYDVRRETDIINPRTSRKDIMCLKLPAVVEDTRRAEPGHQETLHRFVHGRILGIYHANVVYRGRGAVDLRRRRFDFLWVRWFDYLTDGPVLNMLDRMSLKPLSNPAALGFLDPADVLRASHIIPRYISGKLSDIAGQEGRIWSKVARDKDDWREYYVNCFIDRDMLMRYSWGLAVGHVYAHEDAPNASATSSGCTRLGDPIAEDDIAEESDTSPGIDAERIKIQKDEKGYMQGDGDREDTGLPDEEEDTLDDVEGEELCAEVPDDSDLEGPSDADDGDIPEPDSDSDDENLP
ncbi:hypothetical protein NMY22_g6054 [Coprinellus aureogranulatus]|nr:hypothetical protein NMY22_g6054 [Coprinellus aureogranulatus]